MGASSENFCLRWNDFESNVSGAFRDLRQEADFFDVTLGCPDGKSLQAHKVILSACSSTFKTMLRDTQRNTNSHHPYIFLRGVSFPDLSAVLDFMYHGEVNVAQEDLNSFLAVAEELQIKGLTQKEGGEPSKPKPSGSGAVKRPVQPSSENVSASSTPAVKKIRRSSPDLPEQGQIKTIDIKSDPEAGPSGASQAVNRDGGASADYADESGDFEDYGDYYGEGEGGDNGADGSMMEGGEEGAGGKVQRDAKGLGLARGLSGIGGAAAAASPSVSGSSPNLGKVTSRTYTKMLTPPEELAVHMAKINGVWVCTTCSSNFRDKTDCRRHVESKHIVGTVYRCPQCAFTTNTEAKFRKHERDHAAALMPDVDIMAHAVDQEAVSPPDSDLILVPTDFAETEIVEPTFDVDDLTN